jgi:hypothetical protein
MLPDYVARNRVYWDEVNAPRFAEAGARDWRADQLGGPSACQPTSSTRCPETSPATWSSFGCGTAYFGAWLARRGAPIAPRIVGA